MPRFDLKTDDGLKAACVTVRPRIDREQVREVAALLQEIRDASETRRTALDFQVRVWDDTRLWWGGLMVRRGISAKFFLEKDGIHTWFGQQTGLELPADREQRIERLTALCREVILEKIKKAVDWEPWVETVRTLALFFPEDFTALADPAKVVPLAQAMGFSASRPQVVRAHRQILDRLQEKTVLGPPPDGLEGTVERMLLPVQLYRLLYPKLWVVRAGSKGRDEEYVLSNRMAMLGFESEPAVEGDTYKDYSALPRAEGDERSDKQLDTARRQVWTFVRKIQTGDIIVLPQMKGRRPVAWGTVEGRYEYRKAKDGIRHTRPVNWIHKDIPRSNFGEYEKSLNAGGTVFSIQKHANDIRPLLEDPRVSRMTPLPFKQRRILIVFHQEDELGWLRWMLGLVGDGITKEDLHERFNERHAWAKATTDWKINAASILGCVDKTGERIEVTALGHTVIENDDPDVLREQLLTTTIGTDHVLVILNDRPRSMEDLVRDLPMKEAAAKELLRFLKNLAVVEQAENGILRLTDRGKSWRSAIHWEPESPSHPKPDSGGSEGPLTMPSLGDLWTTLSESAGKENLRFERSLVEALHLGLWADAQRHFAVLSGLSGTGKTQIALRYAMALTGAKSDTGGPVEVISVHPGWHDPGPLLGYVNPLTGNYTRTEFLNFLLDAVENQEQPHVLILDEMNLSHPEQYFAPILSAMEIRDGEIPLHREDSEKLGVPTGVAYPSNLVIIGTVNMDETTMGISDKVLDRAFTLEFWDIEPEKWPRWDGCELGDAEKTKVRGILVELTEALAPARRHFGWRVIKEIVGFLEGRSRDTGIELTAEDALDQVIYAKVLPKLRGSDTGRFRDCLDATLRVLEDRGLDRCADKVKALKEDLEATGSCSFWR